MKKQLHLALLASAAIAIAGCQPPKPPEQIIQKRVKVFENENDWCLDARTKMNIKGISQWRFDELLSRGVKVTGEGREFDYSYRGYTCIGITYFLEGKKSLIDSIRQY